jgi:hypothetical protein
LETQEKIVVELHKILPLPLDDLLVIKFFRVLFPAPWGEKMINEAPVEYPAFERNEKVER